VLQQEIEDQLAMTYADVPGDLDLARFGLNFFLAFLAGKIVS